MTNYLNGGAADVDPIAVERVVSVVVVVVVVVVRGCPLELFPGELSGVRVARCMKKGLWTIFLVFGRHGRCAECPYSVESDDHREISGAYAGDAMEPRELAHLVSAVGETVVITGNGEARTFPVGVWMLTDRRQVVVVGEGGPVSTGEVDGRLLAAAVHARWPGAVVLERQPEVGGVADPRGYSARYVEVRDDGSRVDPAFDDLANAGFAVGPVG